MIFTRPESAYGASRRKQGTHIYSRVFLGSPDALLDFAARSRTHPLSVANDLIVYTAGVMWNIIVNITSIYTPKSRLRYRGTALGKGGTRLGVS